MRGDSINTPVDEQGIQNEQFIQAQRPSAFVLLQREPDKIQVCSASWDYQHYPGIRTSPVIGNRSAVSQLFAEDGIDAPTCSLNQPKTLECVSESRISRLRRGHEQVVQMNSLWEAAWAGDLDAIFAPLNMDRSLPRVVAMNKRIDDTFPERRVPHARASAPWTP